VAIGRLASLKTSLSTGGVNKNTELYSFSGVLSNVSIHIANQGLDTARVFVGIASGSISNISHSDYITYNEEILRNGNITLSNIGIKSGDVLFCKASKADVSFVVQSTFDYNTSSNTGISTLYGKEGSGITTETGFVINRNYSLFTATKNSLTNIKIINQNVSEECRFFVGISTVSAANFSSKDYIIYNEKLQPRQEYLLENIGVGINQTIIARANKTNVSFNVSSVPANTYEGLIDFNTLGISTQWASTSSGIHTLSNVGVGTTNKTNTLTVGGGTSTTNLYVSGITTLNTVNVTGLSTFGNSIFNGIVSFGSSVYFGDNEVLYFGDSNDLYILHNGSISAIADVGAGDLYIANDNTLLITNSAYNENKAVFNSNGSVELYYDNSKKLETAGVGATVYGILSSDSLKVGVGVTAESGIVTAVNGFNSGIGTAVQITTDGNQIIFTVPGVGTTSLTLY
jgi:hypothetical protein